MKSSLPDFFEDFSVKLIETIFRHFSSVCDIHHIDFEYGLIKVDVLLSVAYLIRIAAKRGLWGQSLNYVDRVLRIFDHPPSLTSLLHKLMYYR